MCLDFKTFTVGYEDKEAPVVGTTKFFADFLKHVIVSHIIVNNQNENQQLPNPDFVHNYLDGFIDRKPNKWTAKDKLTVFFKRVKCD